MISNTHQDRGGSDTPACELCLTDFQLFLAKPQS